MEKYITPKQALIDLAGGIHVLADILGLHTSTIYGWRNGQIPTKYYGVIIEKLLAPKYELMQNDWWYYYKVKSELLEMLIVGKRV